MAKAEFFRCVRILIGALLPIPEFRIHPSRFLTIASPLAHDERFIQK